MIEKNTVPVGYDPGDHACEYLVFPQNMGQRLSFDEVSVSRGELYSILTNKEARGRNGTLVAMVNTTKADDIIMHFSRLPRKEREKVQEVTLDLAENMADVVHTPEQVQADGVALPGQSQNLLI
jgi:transposase